MTSPKPRDPDEIDELDQNHRMIGFRLHMRPTAEATPTQEPRNLYLDNIVQASEQPGLNREQRKLLKRFGITDPDEVAWLYDATKGKAPDHILALATGDVVCEEHTYTLRTEQEFVTNGRYNPQLAVNAYIAAAEGKWDAPGADIVGPLLLHKVPVRMLSARKVDIPVSRPYTSPLRLIAEDHTRQLETVSLDELMAGDADIAMVRGRIVALDSDGRELLDEDLPGSDSGHYKAEHRIERGFEIAEQRAATRAEMRRDNN